MQACASLTDSSKVLTTGIKFRNLHVKTALYDLHNPRLHFPDKSVAAPTTDFLVAFRDHLPLLHGGISGGSL